MGSWKIGYAEGLDIVANEAAGMDLYAPWSVDPITLSAATTTTRKGGQVTGIAETTLTDTGNFAIDQFNGGFLKILSGAAAKTAYKITDGTVDAITVKDMDGSAATMVTDGVAINDYYEVVTGSTTFVFPSQRNPVRKDLKQVANGKFQRYKLYAGGISISYGKQPDDIVVLGYLTSTADLAELLILLNLKMTYAGYDGVYAPNELAPLILEMGTHDADHQYLVQCLDVKHIGDGKRGNLIEVMMHFQQLGLPSYRGI